MHRSNPSPSSFRSAETDVTPGSIGASHSSKLASNAASLKSGSASSPLSRDHITRRRHCSVFSDQPSAFFTPIARTPWSIASTTASGAGANAVSRITASPTRSCLRATIAFDAAAHATTSRVSHSASWRHPAGASPDAGSNAASGTGAARRARSFRAAASPPPPPPSSAIAMTSSLDMTSELGTLAAPLPFDSANAPPFDRRTPTRSGYASARSTPASSSRSPRRKENTGPTGSPSPTPGAHHGSASSRPSRAMRFKVSRSWVATLPASVAAARSISWPTWP
mmetsp:Transcript_15445/g.55563  ORF Transcript_15445/g.55563 Transcript_15445/m.55563 type:complete len:282 (-) Transcript_15445:58-903(-)